MTIRQRSARVSPSGPAAPAQKQPPSKGAPSGGAQGPAFAEHLKAAGGDAQNGKAEVTLSAHAQQRLAQRDISMDSAQRQALTDAVEQLDAQGARDAAVMRGDAAFVVNVPSRTVVTALDQSEMGGRVFTQIDSAMML